MDYLFKRSNFLKHCYKYKRVNSSSIEFFLLSFGANLAEYHLNNETVEPIFPIGNYYEATRENWAFPLDNLVLMPLSKYSVKNETTKVSNMGNFCLEESHCKLLTMTTIALCAYKVENTMLKKRGYEDQTCTD